MMSVGRTSATDKARLLRNRFDVLLVTDTSRVRQRQYALIDGASSVACASIRTTFGEWLSLRRDLCRTRKTRQSLLEGLLDAVGINCGQAVFGAHGSMGPNCRLVS